MAAPGATPTGTGRGRTLECAACGTENRDAAKFCKGCGGKLAQAWRGAGADANAPSGAEAPKVVLTGQPLRPEPMPAAPAAALPASAPASAGAIKTVVLIASAVVAFVAIGGLVWSQRGREIEAPAAEAPVAATTAVQAVPAAATPSPALAASPAPTSVHEAAPAPLVVAQTVEMLSAAPAPAPAKPVRKRAAPKVQASAPVVEAPPPPAPAAPAPPPAPPAPQATCGSLNFIAKARCLAAECAKPGVSAHPQCDAVRRQQSIDEEKRNPSGG